MSKIIRGVKPGAQLLVALEGDPAEYWVIRQGSGCTERISVGQKAYIMRKWKGIQPNA